MLFCACSLLYCLGSSSHIKPFFEASPFHHLFPNARHALQMLFVGEMEKERSSNSLRTVSLLSKKLISLLFDRTLKQRTHLYCTEPAVEHFNKRKMKIYIHTRRTLQKFEYIEVNLPKT
jgi:hypothetical protein